MFNSTGLLMAIDRELYKLFTGNTTNAAVLLIAF